jgi:hypothetical protein
MPDTIPGHPHANAGTAAPSGAVHRGWFQHLQALEDAIAYRRARVTAPCSDCTAKGCLCDDHACDLNLIAAYQQTATATILDLSSQIQASRPDGSRAGRGNDPVGLRDETGPDPRLCRRGGRVAHAHPEAPDERGGTDNNQRGLPRVDPARLRQESDEFFGDEDRPPP